MTGPSDRFPDMLSGTRIDTAIDQALNDATVPDDVAPFAGFVDDLRVMADRPVPRPSAELAALLAGDHAAEPEAGAAVTSLRPRRRRRVRARAATRLRVAALGLAGKAAMIAAFATTAVAGAAAGILPEPATRFVQRAIEVVTPFELPATGQDAPSADATEAGDTTAAGKPVHSSPAAMAPAPTVPRPDDARTPTLSGEPMPDATPPVPTISATAIGSTIVRHSDLGAPTPRGHPHTTAPAPSNPCEDADNGRPPDHQPPGGPAPKNGHVPPGHASPGAPLVGPDSDPEPLSTPKGPPPKVGSPGGSSQAPGRHAPRCGRRGGPGPAQDPPGQEPSEPPSHGPGKPQRPGPSPGGEPGQATHGRGRHDPAPPNADGRSASHPRGTLAASGEAPHHADGRPEKDTGSAPATDTGSAPAADVPGPATPAPSA